MKVNYFFKVLIPFVQVNATDAFAKGITDTNTSCWQDNPAWRMIKQLLLTFMALLFIQGMVWAQNTGWVLPSDFDLDQVTEIGNADGVYTEGYTQFSGDNSYIRYKNFNISIPDVSTIDGIQIKLVGRSTQTRNLAVALSWDGGTNFSPDSNVDFTNGASSDETLIKGTPTTTWGHIWSSSELNNTNFRLRVRDSNDGDGDVYIDVLEVIVYYTLPIKSPYIMTSSGTFTVPDGVSEINVKAWGGGGGGSGRSELPPPNLRYAGAGGGGGGFITGTLPIYVSGWTITVSIGRGGNGGSGDGDDGVSGENNTVGYFLGNLIALGGTGGDAKGNTPGIGGEGHAGSYSGIVNNVTSYSGGDGSDSDSNNGGGGGGGAGDTANGGNGAITSGGTGGTNYGGSGGNGSTSDAAGENGSSYGGGGGGASANENSRGGNGANGVVIITWEEAGGCTNPTLGGTIAVDQSICSGDNPAAFTSSAVASGETGTLEYKWQYSTSDSPYSWNDIASSNSATFDDATTLTADRWYRRLARVTCSTDWTGAAESNIIKVTVNTTPAAPTAGAQTFCSGVDPEVEDLVASGVDGATFNWYGQEVGGDALAGETDLSTGTYYVSQTVSGCESSRTSVSLTVNTTPDAPKGLSTQEFCSADNPTIDDIEVDGIGMVRLSSIVSDITWYSTDTGGSPLNSTDYLVDGNTYYASQTVDGCESTSRLAVLVIINTTPDAPTGESQQYFCDDVNPTYPNLAATGSNIKWYDAASDGNLLDDLTILVNGTSYYASQTVNGCESTSRLEVYVTVYTSSSAPESITPNTVTNNSNRVCPGDKVELTVVGNLGTHPGAHWVWYEGGKGNGSSIGTGTTINVYPQLDNTWYFVRSEGGCYITESDSTMVRVWQNTKITKEPDDITVTYGCLPGFFSVVADGHNLSYQWYDEFDNPIEGETSHDFSPTYLEVGTNSYYVIVSGECGNVKSDVVTLTVEPQVAETETLVYYTGPIFAYTPNEESNTATLVLSATILNSKSNCVGGDPIGVDIRTATLSFEIDKGNGYEKIPSAQNLAVDFVDPSNILMGGTAAATVQINIGDLEMVSGMIKVVIGGNYTGDPSYNESPITIVRPMAGGGIQGTVELCNDKSVGFIKLFRRVF